MGEETKIEWARHTFNPWRGCSKVDSGCTHCYAETQSKRNPKTLGVWGDNGSRAFASEPYWRMPLDWNRIAASLERTHEDLGMQPSERPRVFCGSLMDWLEDRPELIPLRARLLATIAATPHLDWLLLSKRPEGWEERMQEIVDCKKVHAYEEFWTGLKLAKDWREAKPPPNVWIIGSVSDQQTADARLHHVLKIPARIHGVSYEPAIGPVDFDRWLCRCPVACDVVEGKTRCTEHGVLSWIIVGGESGPNSRPFNIAWARDTIQQCRVSGVACFVKQLSNMPVNTCRSAAEARLKGWADHVTFDREARAHLKHPKGGDWLEWPEDLRVREMPKVSV